MDEVSLQPTAIQPSFHIAHVTAHPGSTAAGGAVIAGVLSNALSGGVPTTAVGWVFFGLSLAGGVLGALGK